MRTVLLSIAVSTRPTQDAIVGLMTVAICTQCGATKHGAWTPCPECHYDPSGKGLVEEARALYLTDHYRTPEELEAAAAVIRLGEPAPIDPDFVEEMTAEARAKGRTTLVSKMLLLWCGFVVLLTIVGCVYAIRACS